MRAANVTQLVQKPSDHEMALRRQALQIAVQLPANADDARRVLELVGTLLGGFMTAQKPS
jgi:hypothetical protein